MRIRANALHAIALAGTVIALTPAARAESRPAATAAAPVDMVPPSIAAPAADTSLPEAPAVETGTPLALRPNKPLELAHEPPPSSMGWKLVALAAILGGAVFYARKKMWVKPTEDGQLTIVRRATVGFRSELLVVNVEGQRLLLGVTPNSIQSLAVLDADESSPALLDRPAPPQSFGDRFTAMLNAAENQSANPNASRVPSAGMPAIAASTGGIAAEKPASRARKPRATSVASAAKSPASPPEPDRSADEEPDVGSQARGLLALRRPR
ncbi:MAG TPA: flagellar biosynthetic protein FliO [Polyangiaceae bacterium]|jgi:flagellar protein FliO/FliZ|nr:flagellar biosynthetic protein FliO [Polyangiaceae bacterium]